MLTRADDVDPTSRPTPSLRAAAGPQRDAGPRLREAGPEGRRAILLAGSGLPGPRANLPLAHALAESVLLTEALDLAADEDEYLALCGALAIASWATDDGVLPAVRVCATDERWRVREGVALGLQVLGRREREALLAVLDTWRFDADPLVQRARVAAVCEPPLVKDPALAAAALAVCAEATAVLLRSPDRRAPGTRTLRQALGSGWSVAVAADPASGLPAFAALEADPDPDAAWIARSNRGKARLARLL